MHINRFPAERNDAPLVRTRARRYRFIRLASSGSAASLSVDWNQIKRQTRFAPLPQPTPARRGWSALYLPEAGKPAAGWGGVGGGGRSKDMPQRGADRRSRRARRHHRGMGGIADVY